MDGMMGQSSPEMQLPCSGGRPAEFRDQLRTQGRSLRRDSGLPIAEESSVSDLQHRDFAG